MTRPDRWVAGPAMCYGVHVLSATLIVAVASIRGDSEYLEPILQTALDGLRPPVDVEPT
jgi:hypothetical protein